MVLVGNKTDLADQRTITEQEGRELAERSAAQSLLLLFKFEM